MSKTKRKDHYLETGQGSLHETFQPEKAWRDTSDRKKWYKPSKKDKQGWLSKIRKGRKVQLNRAMQRPDEHGQVILPVEKKTDVWYYN